MILAARDARAAASRRWATCRSGRTRWAISDALLLPAFALGLPILANLSRLVRSAMLDALGQDYIRTARAKGVSERAVLYKHALRNALIPFVTSVGIMTGYLLGGAIVVEQVFAIPGLGRLILGAIAERNYPLLQATILVVTCGFVFVNFAGRPALPGHRPAGAGMTMQRSAATACSPSPSRSSSLQVLVAIFARLDRALRSRWRRT